jgi:hypothetical protein
MWVIALEALVALTLLVIIVWLTMGAAQRRDAEGERSEAPKADSDSKR